MLDLGTKSVVFGNSVEPAKGSVLAEARELKEQRFDWEADIDALLQTSGSLGGVAIEASLSSAQPHYYPEHPNPDQDVAA